MNQQLLGLDSGAGKPRPDDCMFTALYTQQIVTRLPKMYIFNAPLQSSAPMQSLDAPLPNSS